jgi:hypothetical protein
MDLIKNQSAHEALARLLEIARRGTGQSRRVADFLLAWHNSEENGGWNPYDLWSLDDSICNDIILTLSLIRMGNYPENLGFGTEISQVWALWRSTNKNSAAEKPKSDEP